MSLDVRPLTARSAVLSLLLGSHPPEAPGSTLVRWGREVGTSERAVRVALTRMVAAGDLDRVDGLYRLSERLLRRQQRQDRAIERVPTRWDGTWHLVVVTTVGADATRRAELRRTMLDDRFAELREGVWTRPANVGWAPGPDLGASVEVLDARPWRPSADLVADLYDLPRWSVDAEVLADGLATTDDLARRIAVAAAIVRHLVADPLLPVELLPADWPGERLRRTYAVFRSDLVAAAGRAPTVPAPPA